MSFLSYKRVVFLRSMELLTRATFFHLHTSRQRLFSCENNFAKDSKQQRQPHETFSVGIKIPRILRKIKDKEQIQRYCLVKNLCHEKHFDEAASYMKKWLQEEAVTTSTILILNGLLYYLNEVERMDEVATLKQIMDARNITGDRSTYILLIDGFGKMKDASRVSQLLIEMTSLGLTPHHRSYIVATKLALERAAFSEAFNYFRKIETVYKEKLDDFCAQFIAGAAQTGQSATNVLNVFDDFRINRIRMGGKTLETTRMYFSSFASGKWETNLSEISLSGVCKNCQQQLKESKFGKQEEQLESYFKNLINLKLKGETSSPSVSLPKPDFKTRDENKLLAFIKYLESSGPFHVIVDGLNIAIHSTYGLDFKPLCSLVEYFSKQGKQVLVVAANDLISPRNSKTVSPAKHEQAMMYLKSISNVYLVKQNQSGIDDLFLIFAALNSFRQHSDVLLVSNDRFMDHQFQMTPQTESDFNKWLHAHQLLIKPYGHAFQDPLIQIRPKYAFNVQSTHDSWHFPSTDGKLWLCVKRK